MNSIKEYIGLGVNIEYKFKKNNPDISEREKEARKIKEKNPGKFPVVCEKDPRSKVLEEMEKSRYMLPGDLMLSQFSYLIRNKITLETSRSLFLLISGKFSPTGNSLISEIYDKYRDVDGFLYITYAESETFGSNH